MEISFDQAWEAQRAADRATTARRESFAAAEMARAALARERARFESSIADLTAKAQQAELAHLAAAEEESKAKDKAAARQFEVVLG